MYSSSNAKRTLFAQFSVVAKALGNGHRLELLEHMGQGERSVEDLARLAGLSVANASQHLQQLRRGGLAVARRAGKHIFYGLAGDEVVKLVSSLRRVAGQNLAEVERILSGYFRDRDSLEPVSRGELVKRMKDGVVTVLDVRPVGEFANGHLPGAVNVPLGELERRLREIPKHREIVAYCRGPYCVLSFEAVAALRTRGYRVRRFAEGYPEWKAAGLPVQTLAAPVGQSPPRGS